MIETKYLIQRFSPNPCIWVITEGKHRPDLVALHDGYNCTVDQNEDFLKQHPPAIDMNASEEQAA